MFAAGIAMALSFARAAGRVPKRVLLGKTAQRAFWLILVGGALVWFPWWPQPFSQLVFSNVLTRIALAMPVPVPVPGIGAGVLEPGQDVGAWLDRVLWLSDPEHPNDESLFGTYPAIVSVLLGAFTGHWIQRTPDRKQLGAPTASRGSCSFVGGGGGGGGARAGPRVGCSARCARCSSSSRPA